MKEYIFTIKYIFVEPITNERVWSCYSNSEEEAWSMFSKIKNMDAEKLKQIFKIKPQL